MRSYLFAAAILFLSACNNAAEKPAAPPVTAAQEKPDFFPVTSYIKGQIKGIYDKKLNPIKYITVNDKTDSVFLKFEGLEQEMTEFLHPEIDSASLASLFTETKFLDQTINAFTFTYDPKIKLPDTMQLNHWDVYIEPETGTVRRIYLTKRVAPDKTLQLTWQNNEWCKIVTIVSDKEGSSKVEKEEKISWDY
ncbi:hypothetical protein [Ferruginibacter sp.]